MLSVDYSLRLKRSIPKATQAGAAIILSLSNCLVHLIECDVLGIGKVPYNCKGSSFVVEANSRLEDYLTAKASKEISLTHV